MSTDNTGKQVYRIQSFCSPGLSTETTVLIQSTDLARHRFIDRVIDPGVTVNGEWLAMDERSWDRKV